MKQFALIIAAALALPGCSNVTKFWESASGATVPGSTVVAAAQAYDGIELVGAAYLGLPRCSPTGGPICRVSSATPIIKGAFGSGRIARNELKVQLRAACGAEYAAQKECAAGIPVASYNTLVAATKTIEDATAAYRAATGK